MKGTGQDEDGDDGDSFNLDQISASMVSQGGTASGGWDAN